VAKKSTPLERVLGRLDRLDTVNLTNLVQRLARERGLFESIFNTLREGVLIVDEDGTIEYANEAAGRMIGLAEADIGSATLWRLVPGLRQSFGPAAEPGAGDGSALTRELELDYPERRIVRLYRAPFQEGGAEGGDPRRFAVILTDITSEKLSVEERVESERISSILLLAAGVAHELGNPLNSLTIHLQLAERLLKRDRLDQESADKLAGQIRVCQEEVGRLDGIIRHFLEAIRPRQPDLQLLNLLEPLEEVLSFQRSELDHRGIAVEVEIESVIEPVMADRDQVKQVFFNLIKNGMEAMQPGGRLVFRSRSDDDFVYLQVGDTGEGISPLRLARVFEPYRTSKKTGHGLGLMIAQRIMREHGGQVGIESREGVGTVVTLQFPRRRRRARLLPQATPPAEADGDPIVSR
jgi:two-component system, sporulation sensor kinase E